MLELVEACRAAHPSHGYRRMHAHLERTGGIAVSADYIRRACRHLGISAKAKKKPGAKKGAARRCAYPNPIFSTWDTVDRPRQVTVSDMTAFWTKAAYWERAPCFDALTKEIVGRAPTRQRGRAGIYHEGLASALESVEKAKVDAVGLLAEGSGHITVIRTDQGGVYTSKAYNEIIKEADVVRSCPRPGKPTDNPVNESLNGWIEEEPFLDFGLGGADNREAPAIIDGYVRWHNEDRPCWAIGHKAPEELYREFSDGAIERRDAFARRALDETPKFVRERLAAAEESARCRPVGTSDPAAA